MSMPKSAAMRAASNSSNPAASSLGERETMRLISCASLVCVFCKPNLNLEKRPVTNRWINGLLLMIGWANNSQSRHCEGGLTFISSLLKLLHMLIRKLDCANEGFAFAEPMAVRATSDKQAETVGNF